MALAGTGAGIARGRAEAGAARKDTAAGSIARVGSGIEGGLRVAPLAGSPLVRRQTLLTKALGKGFRVFTLSQAEHHKAAVIAAQRVRERRRRRDTCSAKYQVSVDRVPYLFSRKRHVMRPFALEITVSDFALRRSKNGLHSRPNGNCLRLAEFDGAPSARLRAFPPRGPASPQLEKMRAALLRQTLCRRRRLRRGVERRRRGRFCRSADWQITAQL
jgi:hypothetical protein